jgi:hypothetical protein
MTKDISLVLGGIESVERRRCAVKERVWQTN